MMMRRWVGLAVVAMSTAAIAQPAYAADDAVPMRDLSVAVLTPLAVVATPTAVIAACAPIAPDYRLSALGDIAQKAALDDQDSRVRRGFGAAMRDYFLFGKDGFHISGGSRYYSRGPFRSGDIDSRGLFDSRYATLLSAPRSVLSRATRRMTPAVTLGYTKLVRDGISLGIEGGAMLGRFDTLAGTLAHAPRLRGAGFDGTSQISQIGRMTFGYHF